MFATVPPPWEWTGDDWSGIQTMILLVAGAVAFWQATEARKLRLERSRPFVILDVDVHETIAEFRITNIGATLARNVRFQFDPPLKSTHDEEPGSKPLSELNLFTKGVPSLPPRKEIVMLFDQVPRRLEPGRDLPDDYDVTISYEDPLGNEYEETMTVGYSHRRDMVYRRRYGINDLAKRLEDIAKEMKKWTFRTSGLKVVSPESACREDRRIDEYYRRLEGEQEEQQEPGESSDDERPPDTS